LGATPRETKVRNPRRRGRSVSPTHEGELKTMNRILADVQTTDKVTAMLHTATS